MCLSWLPEIAFASHLHPMTHDLIGASPAVMGCAGIPFDRGGSVVILRLGDHLRWSLITTDHWPASLPNSALLWPRHHHDTLHALSLTILPYSDRHWCHTLVVLMAVYDKLFNILLVNSQTSTVHYFTLRYFLIQLFVLQPDNKPLKSF